MQQARGGGGGGVPGKLGLGFQADFSPPLAHVCEREPDHQELPNLGSVLFRERGDGGGGG